MTTRMLIDATQDEEIRVAVVENNKLLEYDFEIASRKQLKGNIYLARVTRVEPSLQAAFVEYGGNRHGFLAFSEIHPDYYRIPIADREALLAAQAELAREAEEAELAEIAAAEAEFPHEEAEGMAPAADDIVADAIDAVEEDDDVAAPSVVSARIEDGNFDGEDAVVYGDVASENHDTDDADDADAVEAAPISRHRSSRRNHGDDSPERKRRDTRERSRNLLRQYKIQEVTARRQIMLVQVTKEERGNKGAALTTYLSLAGRYCVLMPNSPRGGGVSRKITSHQDRRRMKELMQDLEVPPGMSVILRTAGVERTKAEIKRDLDYLLRQWDMIREMTLKSSAPALIYEEGNLIKRTIRDMYTREIDEVLVAGDEGYRNAKELMRMLMPSHAKKVQPYRDADVPMFFRYQVESQIEAFHDPVVQLKSGGYVVINPTEALVSIDVNSGKSTRERHIEETALRTNLEAAQEIARQLRLRDLAGLVVIDFIDMEDGKNNAAVERKLKDALRLDRARIQVGRISNFGLLELSRQRLRPSLFETSFEPCAASRGTGFIRTIESSSLQVLRHIHEEALRRRSDEIHVFVETAVALYLLNHKRAQITQLEQQYELRIIIDRDDTLIRPDVRIERVLGKSPRAIPAPEQQAGQAQPVRMRTDDVIDHDDDIDDDIDDVVDQAADAPRRERGDDESGDGQGDGRGDRRRRRRRNRRGGDRDRNGDRGGERGWQDDRSAAPHSSGLDAGDAQEDDLDGADDGDMVGAVPSQHDREGGEGDDRFRRRRGRRGGRYRRRRGDDYYRQPGENTASQPVNDDHPYDAGDDVMAADIVRHDDDDAPVSAHGPLGGKPVVDVAPIEDAAVPVQDAPKPRAARGRSRAKAAEANPDMAVEAEDAVVKPTRRRRTKADIADEAVADAAVVVPTEPKSVPTSVVEQTAARAAETVVLVDEAAEENKPRKGGWWQKIIG